MSGQTVLSFDHALCLVLETACLALHVANIVRLEGGNARLEKFNVHE